MFYEPKSGHPLPHNPFKAIVAPRPIGWISTRGSLGDNLAPYSFFNAVSDSPMQVMFSSTGGKPDREVSKDSVAQIRETGVFCCNLVSFALRDEMNASSAGLPAGEDEFAAAGLQKADCETIDCPRVAAAPAALECRLTQIVKLLGESNYMVLGEVTGVHIDEDFLVDGMFDVTRAQTLSRLGYRDYAAVREVFSLNRPGQG
ncbi:NADH-FMN oxidoreductase RutF, flavin reductase (DIM6/NTAB) family [Pseudooceanicola antarcticus]|uniref:Flavin reductase family protein n=1 Tax=Pseudooceanicola antarcticus TaxID=1247613 RepID=A0A285IVJ9_9RHOB|nr:flavin reductase family protein [Pseudooceanicola antarcticus]PJE31987.1 flavin reductase family protein [Pseudooceanicola antarcticus]SNY51136.1 NADH-FMN oxidoreductase RutF, flavin reductase (DIM6/NTAB) family [Pseudooceanicola antarcticus]